jgi:tetratricopeptide (TPR) repeat protein
MQRKYNESLPALEKALELDPGNAQALYSKGFVLYELGEDEEALTALDKALELDPGLSSAVYLRGRALERRA